MVRVLWRSMWLSLTRRHCLASIMPLKQFSHNVTGKYSQIDTMSSTKTETRNEDIFFHNIVKSRTSSRIITELDYDTEECLDNAVNKLSLESDSGWSDIKHRLLYLSEAQLLGLISKICSLHSECFTTTFSTVQFDTIRRLVSVCSQHVPKWSVPTLLDVLDSWYSLGLYFQHWPVQDFVNVTYRAIQKMDRTLTSDELVGLMFYVSLARKMPRELLHKIECDWKLVCNDLSMSELSVICIGFFKTKSKVNSVDLLRSLAERLKSEYKQVHSIEAAAFLKCFTKSIGRITARVQPSLTSSLLDTFDAFSSRFDSLSDTAVVHTLWCSFGLQQSTEQLLSSVAKFIATQQLHTWRLKDLSRLFFILANFYTSIDEYNHIFTTLTEELRRPERHVEILEHPHCLVTALIGLSMVEHFPVDLLNVVFSGKVLSASKVDIRRDLIQLRESVKLEKQDYQIPRMSKKFERLPQTRRPNLNKDKLSEKESLLKRLLQALDPAMVPSVVNLLPYLPTYDVVIEIFKKDKAIDNNKDLSRTLTRLQDNVIRVAILVLPSNCFYGYRDTSGAVTYQLMGIHVMRKRHLEIKGYVVVQVTSEDLNRDDFNINERIHSAIETSVRLNHSITESQS